ncbi:hypothetical protein C8F01DRAFT_1128398, partial [Mycena amicta]
MSSGLPLLSGPPPILESTRSDPSACRKCGKEFNFLLARPRRCNHCSYMYCHSCTDYQGLMPRTGTETGYDPMSVCAYCIEYLTITAGGRGHLRSLTLAKLRKYISAYNIKGAERAVEKDDLIEAILAAKGSNGCLSPAHESYYRKYSVPDRSNAPRRGMFSRNSGQATEPPLPPRPRPNQSPSYEFARPDLAPDTPPAQSPPPPPPQQQYHPPPPPRPASSRPAQPQYHNPNDLHHSQAHFNSHRQGPPPAAPHATRPSPGPRPSRSSQNLNAQADNPPPRARAASSAHPPPPPRPPSVPPPSLEGLLSMEPESVGALPVHALKAVLFANHVSLGQGALEKSDLVKKVLDLVEEERRSRERRRREEEAEEEAQIEQQRVMMEQFNMQQRERAERERAQAEREAQRGAGSPPPYAPTAPEPTTAPRPAGTHVERGGLCVICQDEDANIAIVDCGHLAMCRACSELVWNTSRECPLCRTRIITEARLLRIF